MAEFKQSEELRTRKQAANKRWYKTHKKSAYAHRDKRRNSIKVQTPPWARRERAAIKRMYKMAEIKQKKTGDKYHVDHIIPLHGKLVSGLHCKANLQVILADDNLTKGDTHET